MSNGINTTSTDLLSGFQFVESDGAPFITLDKQRRFYLNSSARKLVDVKPYDVVSIAYNAETKSVAIVKGGQQTAERSTSVYPIDKRYYLSARHFSNTHGYPPEGAPYYFEYVKGSAEGPAASSVFIFKLRQ